MKQKLLCSIGVILVLICTLASCNKDAPPSSVCVHQWSEWQITKKVTCTENGISARICDKCGRTQEITIYAEGHSYSDWNTVKESTCLTDGISERVCAKCPSREIKTIVAPGSHSFEEWTIAKEETCFENGEKERVCSACQTKETETIKAPGAHNFGDWTILQAKTCTTDGTKERTCECGEKETETIPAAHKYVNGICSECGEGIIDITLPTTPIDVSWISNNGTINNTLKITAVTWEVVKDNTNGTKNIQVCYSGEKIYNSEDIAQTSTCHLIYKLYDAEGYVIASGSLEIDYLAVSDKFKNNVFVIENLNPNESYTLVLCDAN